MRPSQARPRVRAVVRALDRNASVLLTGFGQLHRQGRIQYIQEMKEPPAPLTSSPWHLRDKEDSNIEIEVDGRGTGFVDFHDSWELNAAGLRNHAVYFKRSLDPSKHARDVRRKLVPLGLIYEVWSDEFDRFEALRILTHQMPWRRRATEFTGYALKLAASWANLGPRANLSLTSGPPDPSQNPRVLFMAGLWDPADVARQEPSRVSEFEAINLTRSACIRQLRAALGDRFHGGAQRSAFACHYAPDTLLPDARASSKRRYLETVRDHPICIATMGLHGSNGCKLAEYVALSRAIVSEPLRYLVPGPFEAGSHYLPFESPEECVRQVMLLVERPTLREQLMRNNWDYYNARLRPVALAMRVLETILERA